MNLRDRINLIPRNNWDYKLPALMGALAGAGKNASQFSSVEAAFHQPPIWTNAGRTSLYAILKSLELPPGAQVGVPLFCCSVVFNAICQAGLTPRFLDSNIDDFNLSVEDFEKKRLGLAAVVAIHMFGSPCDMDAILDIAGPMPVIEDCAQSLYSTYKGKQTGFLSTASFFSFRCGKYLSAGEGSAIFCKEPQLHKKIETIVDTFESWTAPKMVANSLSTFVKATLYNRPWFGLIGYPVGMRLDRKLNLTAKDGFETCKIAPSHLALIDARIEGYRERINVQRDHAHALLNAIEPNDICLPSESRHGVSNWYQFALRFQNTNQRNQMAEYLYDQGIDTAKYLSHAAEDTSADYGYRGDCPNAELLSKTNLLIPIHYSLHHRDIEHIASSINKGLQKLRTREGAQTAHR